MPRWGVEWSSYSSFPSGHTRETAAEITVLITFWRRIWPLGLLYVVLLDSSRVSIGVHFPLDVVAGTILGWVIARIAFVAHEVYLAPRLDRRRGMGTAGHAVARVVGPTNGREKKALRPPG